MLEAVAKEHKLWIKMCINFGVPNHMCEDLVQDMYLRVNRLVKDESKIYYKDDRINHFFFWTILKNMWSTICRRESKNPYMGYSDTEMDESWSMTHIDSVSNRDELEAVDRLIDKIYGEVGSWEHWYDRELFRIYFGSHISLRQLSRDTKISLTSIHNSVKKYKIKLRERFGEDWEDFLNNQFDLI